MLHTRSNQPFKIAGQSVHHTGYTNAHASATSSFACSAATSSGTPSGMLLHGIMSTIAEFYSRKLATEVIKGMTRKQQQLEERLAVLDHDINQARQDYAPNRQALDQCLTLLADPQALYRQSDEPTRRLANQVFFPKGMFITEDPTITGQGRFHLEAKIAEPFNSLREPVSASQHAGIAADQGTCGSNVETPYQGERLNCSSTVPPVGFEPTLGRF